MRDAAGDNENFSRPGRARVRLPDKPRTAEFTFRVIRGMAAITLSRAANKCKNEKSIPFSVALRPATVTYLVPLSRAVRPSESTQIHHFSRPLSPPLSPLCLSLNPSS